ncbi:MAG: hypothetical protein Q7S75_00315 [bacterium]|nr:hypothetical protein [bacterium]
MEVLSHARNPVGRAYKTMERTVENSGSNVFLKYTGVTPAHLAQLHAALEGNATKSPNKVWHKTRNEQGAFAYGHASFVELLKTRLEIGGKTYTVELRIAPRISIFAENLGDYDRIDGDLDCTASVINAIHTALGVFPDHRF